MTLIKKFTGFLLDCILPQRKEVRDIEKISAEEFQNKASRPQNLFDLEKRDIYPLFSYRSAIVKEAIWQLKYRRNRKIARLLATVLYEEIVSVLEDRELFFNFTKPIVIPLPISKKRRKKRGYNQIEFLLSEFKVLDTENVFEFLNSILIKSKETLPQTLMKDRRLRLLNLRGCFEVVGASALKNRNIILIDDVVTTGSTLLEAKRTLLLRGAKKVICFTLAH